jgi:hypothetical protein
MQCNLQAWQFRLDCYYKATYQVPPPVDLLRLEGFHATFQFQAHQTAFLLDHISHSEFWRISWKVLSHCAVSCGVNQIAVLPEPFKWNGPRFLLVAGPNATLVLQNIQCHPVT